MGEIDEPDEIEKIKAELERILGHEVDLEATGPLIFTPPELDPGDPRLREQPPASDRLLATFKWEDQAEDGEDIGPLIVFDSDADDVVWESPDWIRASEARRLADGKGWRFGVDGSSE